MDGGDDRDLALVDGGERRRAAPVHSDEGGAALALDLLDVDARAEAPALGGHDHHPDGVAGAELSNRVGKVEPALHVERVHRRDVDDDLGHPVGAVGHAVRDAHGLGF